MAPKDPPEPPDLKSVPKPKQRRHGAITAEIYERMAQAYLTSGKRSMRGLARACGVSEETASKAITLGWPDRKWPSLRERAELFDRQTKSSKKRAEPMTLEEAQALRAFLEMKVESVNNLRAISGFAQNAILKLSSAVDRATADRQGIRHEEVVDVYGTGKSRREVHRTVIRDVVLPPYLPHVVAASRAVAEVVATAHEALRRWMITNPGHLDDGAGKRVGIDDLTDEQQAEIIKSGKLPPGMTWEMLRGKS